MHPSSVRAADGAPDPARWKALSLCLVAGFMTLLDVSIVNVALPSIRTDLDAGESEVQWIVAGYALAFGMVLVPAGRLGDARSRRGVFALGLGLFTLFSAACGAAPSATWLVVFRLAQGLSAGLISPQVSGFIQTMFQGAERARAFGMFGATVGISTAVGPLLGGVLVTTGGEGAGWRWVFLVNVPVGVVALLLVRTLLPEAVPRKRRESLDPVGVALFGTAILFALLPLVQGSSESLGSRPWWLLLPSAGLLVGFAWWERRWHRGGRATLMDLRLVRVRSYVLGLGLGTFFFAGFTSVFLVLTLYLQSGLGYTALQAGVTQTAFALGSAVAATLGGRYVTRWGRSLVVGGLVICAAGLVALDLLVSLLEAPGGGVLAPALLVCGFGTGLVISPNVTLTVSEVDVRYAGSAGGMLQTAQRVGSAIGVALVLAQFFAALASSHGDFTEALSIGLRTTLAFVLAALALGLLDLWLSRDRRRIPDVGTRPADPHPAETSAP
jgi:EmrB/QacA subfamily drug resistance transporter